MSEMALRYAESDPKYGVVYKCGEIMEISSRTTPMFFMVLSKFFSSPIEAFDLIRLDSTVFDAIFSFDEVLNDNNIVTMWNNALKYQINPVLTRCLQYLCHILIDSGNEELFLDKVRQCSMTPNIYRKLLVQIYTCYKGRKPGMEWPVNRPISLQDLPFSGIFHESIEDDLPKDISSFSYTKYSHRITFSESRFRISAHDPLFTECELITAFGDFTSAVCASLWCDIHKHMHAISHVAGTEHRLKDRMNCNSTNIIYLISCRKCPAVYVGHTLNSLKAGFNEHKSDVKKSIENNPLVIHFNSENHEGINDMMLQGIELVKDVDSHKIEERKAFWIWELGSSCTQYGLNVTTPLLPSTESGQIWAGDFNRRLGDNGNTMAIKY